MASLLLLTDSPGGILVAGSVGAAVVADDLTSSTIGIENTGVALTLGDLV